MDLPSVLTTHKKKLSVAVFFISLSWKTFALSSLSSVSCPNQFEGVVVNMADSSTPFSSLKKIKLDFHVKSRVKGTDREYEEVYYPQNGIKTFNVGDKFKVKLKDGLICSLTKI